jgi:thiol-disulfide isomerase/thioredoxin
MDQKYLKYKSKYLRLKNSFQTQTGGAILEKPNLYLFKAEWCGHCKKFQPAWNNLENNSELKKKVNFVTMDSELQKNDILKFNIDGYPTIILEKGNKLINYENHRTITDVTSFINQHV